MPQPPWLRDGVRRTWAVPQVAVVVEAGEHPFELVRGCVDRLLASDQSDLRVVLVGDWDGLTDRRRAVLADPQLDRRLIAATYRSEPRVVLAGEVPETAFPSPFLLRVPARIGVGRGTVRRLMERANYQRAGLLRVALPGTGPDPAEPGAAAHPVTEPVTEPVVELWRTAAVSRARRRLRPGEPLAEPLAEAVADVWGAQWLSGAEFGLVDLADRSPDQLAPVPGPAAPAQPPAVPVAGFRSLLRATGYVFRLAVASGWRRVRGGR
jgi:hypothetical protein